MNPQGVAKDWVTVTEHLDSIQDTLLSSLALLGEIEERMEQAVNPAGRPAKRLCLLCGKQAVAIWCCDRCFLYQIPVCGGCDPHHSHKSTREEGPYHCQKCDGHFARSAMTWVCHDPPCGVPHGNCKDCKKSKRVKV